MMAELPLLARMYNAIMFGFVCDGRAPHYTELGRELGLRPEEARQALHQLINVGLRLWLAPHTDYIASFAPFSNLPTQYLVSVDGQQRWYAQCGFESLAISWLFPGGEVSVDCPCLDCGEPINVRMRDGNVLVATPPTIAAHVGLPAWRWRENWAYT
jgi:hypothetical protein